MRKRKVKIRIMHNKKLFVFIILLIVLVIVLAFLIPKNQVNEGKCRVNSDCVKQQVTCCSCSMGGREKCMTKSEAREMQEKLGECEKNIICPAVYACQETSCSCVEGSCVEE